MAIARCCQCQAHGLAEGLRFFIKVDDGVLTCVGCQLHRRCDYDVEIIEDDDETT